ncbi:hypothetical protein [Streptomyces iakyrus]|uniref:Uncharacterized protein n=1 Tax=Streptomyces iakyrus TaxID=68219 RepID=A0ABW8FEE0_9ACTN
MTRLRAAVRRTDHTPHAPEGHDVRLTHAALDRDELPETVRALTSGRG